MKGIIHRTFATLREIWWWYILGGSLFNPPGKSWRGARKLATGCIGTAHASGRDRPTDSSPSNSIWYCFDLESTWGYLEIVRNQSTLVHGKPSCLSIYKNQMANGKPRNPQALWRLVGKDTLKVVTWATPFCSLDHADIEPDTAMRKSQSTMCRTDSGVQRNNEGPLNKDFKRTNGSQVLHTRVITGFGHKSGKEVSSLGSETI